MGAKSRVKTQDERNTRFIRFLLMGNVDFWLIRNKSSAIPGCIKHSYTPNFKWPSIYWIKMVELYLFSLSSNRFILIVVL